MFKGLLCFICLYFICKVQKEKQKKGIMRNCSKKESKGVLAVKALKFVNEKFKEVSYVIEGEVHKEGLRDLDDFMIKVKERRERGSKRASNKEYEEYTNLIEEYKRKCEKLERGTEAYKEAIKQLKEAAHRRRSVPSEAAEDDGFRRVYYVSCFKEFVIGFAGPVMEGREIKEEVAGFLKERLKRIDIVNIGKKKVYFLNVEVIKSKNYGVQGESRKQVTVSMKAPISKILKRFAEKGLVKNSRRGKTVTIPLPTRVGALINLDHKKILDWFNRLVRILMDYYSFVDNRAALTLPVHLLRHSCALTLASKLNLGSKAKVMKKFGPDLRDPISGVEFIRPSFVREKRFVEAEGLLEEGLIFWTKSQRAEDK